MANLAARKPVERTIEIKDPESGEPIGISVTIISTQDARMKGARRQMQDTIAKREQRGKLISAEDREKMNTEYMVKGIIGWDWQSDDDWNGEKHPEFSREKVTEVLNELEWFRRQIDEEMADDKAFFGS